jgi:hypothetical protein
MQNQSAPSEGQSSEQTANLATSDGAACPPSSIFLQWYGDQFPSDCDEEPSDVTWCKDKVFTYDVRYIKAESTLAHAASIIAKHIKTPMTQDEISIAIITGDYSAELILQHVLCLFLENA